MNYNQELWQCTLCKQQNVPINTCNQMSLGMSHRAMGNISGW